MGIKNFSVLLDNSSGVYYPGQLVSGRVIILVDSPKKIRAVRIKFKGKASVKWTKSESYTGSDGKSYTKTITCTGNEQFFKNEYNLVGKGHEFELPVGEHVYNFSNTIPFELPSTYNGEYGGVTYYVKAKMDIPWAVDKKVKAIFQVHNPYNLNINPQLKSSVTDEDDKTFCCLCCTSGPLVLKVHVPKTGFSFGETVPITVEINNNSNVSISAITCSLIQTIKWMVSNPGYDSKTTKNKLIVLDLGEVSQRTNRVFSENLIISQTVLPNLTRCNIIEMSYYLKVTAEPKGAHTDLDVHIPVQLGDVPLCDDESGIPPTSSVPNYPNPSTIDSFGFKNPSTDVPNPQFPNSNQPIGSSTGQFSYPNEQFQYPIGGQQPYPTGGQQPYPTGGQQPYPTGGQQPYPAGGQPPYPAGGQQPYPTGGQQPYPAGGQPPYPAGGQQPYPAGGQQPYPTGGQQPYPAGGQQPYPTAGQQPYPAGGQQPYPTTGQQPYPTGGQPYPTSGQQPYPSGGQLTYSSENQPQYPNSGQLPSSTGQSPPTSNAAQSIYPPGIGQTSQANAQLPYSSNHQQVPPNSVLFSTSEQIKDTTPSAPDL